MKIPSAVAYKVGYSAFYFVLAGLQTFVVEARDKPSIANVPWIVWLSTLLAGLTAVKALLHNPRPEAVENIGADAPVRKEEA